MSKWDKQKHPDEAAHEAFADKITGGDLDPFRQLASRTDLFAAAAMHALISKGTTPSVIPSQAWELAKQMVEACK